MSLRSPYSAGIKYRPSLSLSDMQFIYDALLVQPASPQQQAILASFNKLLLKAKHGITTPSHVATGSPTIEASLGFSSEDHSIETLLDAWASNPSILSPVQLARVQHYRYTNDMMTADEESAYERSQ